MRTLAPLLLVAAGLAVACSSTEEQASSGPSRAPQAPVVKVVRQSLSTSLDIASEFLPFQEIDVYAKESGYIQKLYVDWGTHVKQGQLMAVLEIPELEQQIQGDEAAVVRSEHDVDRAQEELARAQSSYTVAHVTYTRLTGVQTAHPALISQEDIDVAQGKDLEGSAAVSAAKAGVSAAQAALSSAQAARAKDQALYKYARMTAPFDGVVTRMDTYTGALLPAGTSSALGQSALCHLSQNNVLRLVIPIPERVAAEIHLDQEIAVNVSALHKTFSGKVIRYSDQIDLSTRTMHTEVQVSNPRYDLIPGMYADVQVPIHTGAQTLTLPIQAVQARGTGTGTVLIVSATHHIERRNVTVGIETANTAEIVRGVNEGEMAIYGEQDQYEPGMLVTPQLTQPPSVD